jgi:hypothetical protein
MITRRQMILLAGVTVIFGLDIVVSWIGALFCDGFVEANPLYLIFTGQPAALLAALTLPKAALVWFFAAAADWFNRRTDLGILGGDIACLSAFVIQLAYAAWLIGANITGMPPPAWPIT